MDREILKGYIDLLILGIIKIKKNYGYNIIKEIYELSNSNLEISDGTLYLALKRLEKKNLISSYWDDTNTYPKRKYYQINDNGIEYLNEKYNDLTTLNLLMKNILERSN